MAKSPLTNDRRKQLNAEFSNYENAVTLISSLETWFEYQWGINGIEVPNQLEVFNRFPQYDGLTPDFEVRFRTPYTLWGEHKRTIQSSSSGRDSAVQQIVRYAEQIVSTGDNTAFDVMVLVNPENDDIAAEAIDAKRTERKAEDVGIRVASIVVFGCHLDRETINKEWYKLKWRDHYQNCRFTEPNVCSDSSQSNLNALLVDSTHHAVPVNRAVLGIAGRHPFINDDPPPLYTAVRLVVPAINELLTEAERDLLQSIGSVDKSITKDALLATDVVNSLDPRPTGLSRWIDGALEFFVVELGWAQKVAKTSPQEYLLTVDNRLVNADTKDWLSKKAARRADQRRKSNSRGVRFKGDDRAQMSLFP